MCRTDTVLIVAVRATVKRNKCDLRLMGDIAPSVTQPYVTLTLRNLYSFACFANKVLKFGIVFGLGTSLSVSRLREKIATSWRAFFSLRVLVIVICAIVFAVLAGPFGTLNYMTTLERTILWAPLISVSVLFGWATTVVTQVFLEGRHPVLYEMVAVSLMTATFAPCVWFYVKWIDPDVGNLARDPLEVATYVLFVVGAVSVVRHAVLAWRPEVDDPAALPAQEPRLFQRLPASLRAPILRLSAKDHRVAVVTQAGTAELRLRLGDAVAEMEPVEGFMAHRSHWVAKSAVVEAQRRGADKLYLKLSNGDLVPVSRTFRPDWMETGLLQTCSDLPKEPVASAPPSGQDPSESRSSPSA